MNAVDFGDRIRESERMIKAADTLVDVVIEYTVGDMLHRVHVRELPRNRIYEFRILLNMAGVEYKLEISKTIINEPLPVHNPF